MKILRYTTGECSLGYVVVAVSDKGVRAIMLGDTAAELEQELQRRFPRTSLVKAAEQLQQLLTEIVMYVEHPSQAPDMPLDIQGTAFQQRVWHALSQIPAGSTSTYAAVAASINSPASVRAVANACAANALAIVVPCHRVVKSDGSLSGYRWGAQRKRALLDREAGLAI